MRILLVVLLFALASVAAASSQPEAEHSKYLATKGAGFLMKVGVPAFGGRYGITFEIRKRLRRTIFALVTFENPENPEKPFVVTEKLGPRQTEFLIQSPSFFAAENQRVYYVDVRLFEDEAMTREIGSHRQGVLMDVAKELEERVSVRLK